MADAAIHVQTNRATAVHLERAVREVAVEAERQADGPQKVRGRPQGHERPRERHEEDQQRGDLHRSRTLPIVRDS